MKKKYALVLSSILLALGYVTYKFYQTHTQTKDLKATTTSASSQSHQQIKSSVDIQQNELLETFKNGDNNFDKQIDTLKKIKENYHQKYNKTLIQALHNVSNTSVKIEIIDILQTYNVTEAIPDLMQIDYNQDTRLMAPLFHTLGILGASLENPQQKEEIAHYFIDNWNKLPQLKEADAQAGRILLIESLGMLGDPLSIQHLENVLLQEKDLVVCNSILPFLGSLGQSSTLVTLEKFLDILNKNPPQNGDDTELYKESISLTENAITRLKTRLEHR